MQASADSKIAVGGYWFDVAKLELIDPCGHQVKLRPQSAEVLKMLVQSRGELVTKSLLMDTVWADFSVTDDSLVQCISEIRKALGSEGHALVKTVPRRGYLLVGGPALHRSENHQIRDQYTVESAAYLHIQSLVTSAAVGPLISDLHSIASDIQLSTATHTTFRFSDAQRAIKAALAAVEQTGKTTRMAIAAAPRSAQNDVFDPVDIARLSQIARCAEPGEILADQDIRQQATDLLDCIFVDRGELGLDTIRARLFGVHALPQSSRLLLDANYANIRPTIAIIPPATNDPTDKTISDVFADDMIASLSRLPEVNVISRLSSTVFRERETSLNQIRNALNADYILSGHLHSRGSNRLFALELSQMPNGNVLWADRIQATEADILDRIETVQKVVSIVRKHIALKSAEEVRRRGMGNVANHSLLFAAIHMMHRLTPADFDTAKDMLSELNLRCPEHATPLALLARWHVLRLQQGWVSDARADAQAALECAQRALDLEPENASALTSQGHVLTNLWRNLEEAEACYDAALNSQPSEANALVLRGMLYGYQDRGKEAKRDTERALHLTPFDPHRFFYLALAAGANLAAGDNERALELSNESLRLNKNHTSTLRGKITALKRLGRDEEAAQNADHLLRLQPDFRISKWLSTTPAADFEIGRIVAEALKGSGLPN